MNNTYKTNKTDWRRLGRSVLLVALLLGGMSAQAQTTPHATGIDGNVVYLNDLEPHSWSYYSDKDCPVRSLHPVDVEIHYLGNGIVIPDNSTPSSISNNDASSWRIASGAEVSYNESQNEFVYYKTLERTDGATAATVEAATGRCEYTTIPNPFSKRPVKAQTSRTMYLNWTRSNSSNGGTITVNYTNASGSSQTFTQTINGNSNTTLTMKVGTTFTYTVTCTANNNGRYNTFSVRYDGNSGTQIVNETVYRNNTASGTSDPIPAPLPGDSDWRGFYKWRIKTLEHGTIHSASTGGTSYAQGAIVDAEQTLHFQPASGYEESGMKVEFEAVWARAYVTTNTSSLSTYASGTNAYERNFNIITSAQTASNLQKSYPLTISGYYPNGTSAGGSLSGSFSGAANTKFENIYMDGTTFSANNHDLIMGRGIRNATLGNRCLRNIEGMPDRDNNYTSTLNYTMRIESGVYDYISFINGNYDLSNAASSTYNTIGRMGYNCTQDNNSIRVVMGSDYDRAKSDNTILKVTNTVIMGVVGSNRLTGQDVRKKTLDCTIKSGRYFTNLDNQSYGMGNAPAGTSMYFSLGGSQSNVGKRYLTIEGGDLANIAGGIDNNCNNADTTFTIRMKGGTVRGAIYGSGAFAACKGKRKYVITGGNIHSWIAGGCNGVGTSTGGTLDGETFIYVGGTVKVGYDKDGNASATEVNEVPGGTVFAAGRGNSTDGSGRVTNSTLVLADMAKVLNNAYGGGNLGFTENTANVWLLGNCTIGGKVFGGSNIKDGNTTNIYMKGGTVTGGVYGGINGEGYAGSGTFALSGNTTINISGGTAVGGVYGGGYGTNNLSCDVNGTVTITMTGGTVKTGLFGGGNVNSKIGDKATLNLNGGTVGVSAVDSANVYGGGLGALTRMKGDVEVNIGGATIHGDVYGGSAKGITNCNDAGTALATGTKTDVALSAGTVFGSIYGGGHGIDAAEAHVWGPVTVTVSGGSVKDPGTGNPASVFGCNNAAGTPKNTVAVSVTGTDPTVITAGVKSYAINGVYGGGNEADYKPTTPSIYPSVTISGCTTSIKDVYGGGNAAAVPYTSVTVNGGDIDRVFGGGNGERGTEYPAHVGRYTASNTTYGSGNTNVAIHGGTINQVFGGSNNNGEIKGSINVGVSNNSTGCDIAVGEVYGGGNQAPSQQGTVTIGCMDADDIIDYVYGGANDADITGDISLTMTGGRVRNLFGGNNTGHSVNGGITVTVNWTNGNEACSNNYLGNVFGGGNLAQYTVPGGKALTVNILNGTVSGNVYGGGKGTLVDGEDRGKDGKVTGDPAVTIGDNNNNHTAIVLGDVYGGGDAADVAGEPVIEVTDCNSQVGNVYGGGNAADVNGATITINGGTIGDAFGGGHGDKDASSPSKYADVKGDVTFNVNGGTIARVFAGSNSRGTITGTSSLTINKTGSCAMKIGEVYGGGNEAAGIASSIDIGCTGTLVPGNSGHAAHPENIGTTLEGIGYVYGGANQANIGASGAGNESDITVTINSGIVANVFGGNNTSGTIYGDIEVNIEKTSESNTCGWYVGNVFGGGNLAAYTGDPEVNIKNGTVSQNVYGGGKGASAVVTGSPVVTIGDATNSHAAIVSGNVYGGGDAAAVTGTTTVTYNDNNASSQVYKLFGGGNEAGVSSTATVTMTNGKVTGGIYGGCNSSGTVTGDITVYINGGTLGVQGTPLEGGIFGGGYGASTETEGNVTVNVGDANAASAGVCPVIYGDIYGGSALGSVNDAVGDLTTVNFNNGTLHGNLYGGGLGAATLNGYGYIESVSTEAIVNGTVHVNIGTSEQLSNFVTIDGKVFGCNNLAGTPKGHVYVDVYRTAHSGSNTYPSPEPASAADIPTPTTANFAIAEVYGGGNLAHYTTNTENASTHVHIHNCDNTIQYVYGGGNAANTVANEVTIDGGRMEYVFGGGNGKGSGNPGANVEGNATVKLGGGVINYVFGGSNTLGVVNGTASVDFLSVTCSRKVYELYGGGNEAPGGTVNMTIPCGATGLNVVYGGSKNADIGTQELFEAETKKNITLNIEGGILSKVFGGNNQGGDVWGDVILNLKGGTIVDAFGGNNQGGNIKGSITVNVDEDETLDCPLVLTNVFGGGKDAAYTPASASILYPQVNIKHKKSGTSITGSVYGGGQGSGAVVTANPVVTIGDNNANHLATIAGNVYGGGDAAAVTGNTTVTYNDNNASSQVANLFGGGNAASVSGTTTVTMTSGKVTAGVYGGCNSSGSVGAVTVALNGGQVGTDALHADVYGGGYGASTGTTGNIGVTLNGTTVYGDLYGGSALGSVNANTSNTTTVTLTSATLHGSVFGGGKGDGGTTATSEGQAIVNINVYDQYLTGIYGGANVRGLVKGDIAVNVNANVGASGDGNSLNIFGGGYGAATNTNGNVTVTIGNEAGTIVPTIYGDIYGGSALGNVNDAAADVTTVNFLNGTLHGNLYGGGLGDGSNAAKVNGQVVVNISNTTQTEENCHIDLREATIYGCNNTNGSPQDNVTVNIYKTAHTTTNAATYTENDGVNGVPTYAIDQVFGGGNQADYDPTSNDSRATVHVYGCNNTIRRVFGGGNAAAAYGVVTTIDGGRFDYIFGGGNGEVTAANIGAGGTNLTVNSGVINYLFGGSNQNGTIAGPMGVVINNTGCTEQIKNFFAGGNLAVIGTPESPATLSTTIACGTVFDAVYGGSNLADIYGDVTLTINGGTIGEVFAGSKGRSATSDPGNSTPKAANINGDVTLNIYGGAIGKAFGGSNINGNITGTATVNLDWSQSDCAGKSIDYIYGASNLATYTPSPKPEFSPMVNLINGTVNFSVFGAGKGADDVQAAGKVTSNPKVNMSGASAWVKKNVYGGGEMATVDGNTYVNISNGIVGPADLDPTDIDGHGDVFGGGLGKAGANYSTFAFVTNANVTLSGGTVRGSVFGGGENGHVSNNTSVTVSGGVVGVRIPYAYRNISSDAGSSNPVYAGNVYGGGRGVDHTAVGNHLSETAGRVYGNTSVSVTGGQIHHSVYGGGSLASVGTYTLTPASNIYGGHLHTFTNGTGNATVSISGGRIGPTWDELLLDDEGNSLVDANGDALNAAAATTIAHNYECLGENEGMVYGSGRGVNYTNDGNEDHQLYVEMAFTNNTTVTISNTADVVGSVFGGGENGHVKGNTQVNIQGGTIGGIPLHHKGIDLPGHSEGHGHIDDDDDNDDELGYNETGIGRSVFRGNVYGGGRGIDHTDGDATTTSAHIFSVSAGRVYGNTVVNVTGGRIYHNVFGGGSIASVGTYSYPSDGNGGYDFFTDPEAATSNTGTTTVNISGGQIGVMGENEGYVYGGGRGIAGTNETQVSHLAFVNETHVTISQTNSTHADVRASVFGGGMNGHVLTNTLVEVSGGVIGGKTAANYANGAESYDPDIFTAVPGTVDYTIHGINYYSGIRPGDTITTSEGLGPATVFLGNVYGGGRGVDVTSGSNLSYTAGRVYGNTVVNITGGVIYHSVFGGGSIASVGTYTTYTADEAAADAAESEKYRIVANQPKTCTSGGKATVNVSGGRIGTNGRNNGRVFGSSRGMAGTNYRGLGYVNIAHVNISSTAEVRGSVFGSGENGHVLDSTLVTVSGGHIGNGKRTAIPWLNSYIGNVYGGGRGLDRSNPSDASTVSPFAGRVYRSANVVVTGGTIDHNVYGGGSLASVGRFKRNNNNEITYNDPDKGIARVTISGGTIGSDGDENGHVFGASRGTAVAYQNSDIRANLAYVAGTRVNVSGGTIKGSVFGGGESGHVQRDARVTVSGGEIGSTIPSDYTDMSAANKKKYDLMGNVYGAGRGIDECQHGANYGYSMSAGYVRGRTIVTITGTPTIHRNVYGGGSMGSVGDYGPYCRLDFWQGDPTSFARGTAANNYTDASNGVATVVIKGPVGTAADVARNYGGNVYGSCRGMANDPSHDAIYDEFYAYHGGFGEMAYVTGSHVIVETGANVQGNVYGGGENGHVDFGGTLVNILNGHVHGNVFGGGKGTSTSPTAGIVDGDATVNIGLPSQDANTPDAYGSYNTVEIDGNVFGGNDSYSSPLGTMTVNVYHTKHTAANKYPTLSDPVQASDTADNNDPSKYALKGVYGGGNLADVLTGIAAVDASDDNASHVYDQRYITQRISATNSNPAGFYPWPGGTSRKSVVNIYNCEENTIMYVYGGGRSAYTIEDEVNIYGGRIYQAYAGGDGRADPAYVGYLDGANLRTVPANNNHGKAVINIIGGIVNQVFGGCNTQGEVNGTSTVNFAQGLDCDILNSEVFGGNNQADMTRDKEVTIQCGSKWNDVYGGSNEADLVGNIILNIVGGSMNRAFGGSKNADIDGNVTVNVYGGHIGELFGGNNAGGNITGTITVNVDIDPDYNCPDGLALTTVYGGGKDAAYEPFDCFRYSPKVNIKNTSTLQISEVYGGGYGATAQTVSYPRVIVGGFGDGKVARVYNNVYGGGYGAPVYGNTVALVRSSVIGNDAGTAGTIFGGGYGNTAVIHGETYVGVFGTSDIKQNVYGGGNAGAVLGSTDVQVAYEEQLLPPETRAVMDEGTVYATFDGYPGASIRYTLDGTEPTTTTGYEYNGTRFAIDFEDNIQAIAYKDGMIPSVVSVNQTPTPTITIDGASATLDGYLGAKLYYTTDGTEPTTSSSLYGGAAVDETGYNPAATISVTANSVIKVLAVMRGCANSHVAYLQAPQPEISSDGANYTITAPAGARIIYTTFTSTPTGSNPTSAMGGGTEHGTKVSEANDDDDDDTSVKKTITLTDGETLKAIVELDGYMPSIISAVKYTAAP